MQYTMSYTLVAGVGGSVFYIFTFIQSGGGKFPIGLLLACFGMGCLGGFIPGIFRDMRRKPVPFLQSWFALAICIYSMPFTQTMRPLYWQALIFGYITHLLWEGYRRRLPQY